MSTQPDALELARWAEKFCRNVKDPEDFRWKAMADMAAELLRLHAENAQLREQNTALDAACARLEAVRGTQPTDDEIDALWDGKDLTIPQLVQRRIITRAALAKWGTPVVAKWAPEEIAGGERGIRWVTNEGIHGRPTDHDVREYLKRTTTAHGCHCDECKQFYSTPQPVREPLTCEWSHNDNDGFWETSCGEAWRFDDGGPKENSMNFCHGCGKTLRITGGQHGTE